jgi:AraC-like DNA-binding protein
VFVVIVFVCGHPPLLRFGPMTVAARSANFAAPPAKAVLEDMRDGTPVRAGTYPYDGPDLVTGWHRHDLHQIEYAFRGVVEVETADAHHLLPPQQTVWIPAGLAHRTTLRRVRTVSVFFDPAMVPLDDGRARILAAAPVIKEMILYAVRWPIDLPASDVVADTFFDALALLCREWLDHETPLCLPVGKDPDVDAVLQFTNAHLNGVTEADVCASVGWSERTLRRKFSAATGMTWRHYLLQSRLLRGMALLSEPGPTVLEVATAVGFESVSAFSRAFRRLSGETPTAYRRRVTGPARALPLSSPGGPVPAGPAAPATC